MRTLCRGWAVKVVTALPSIVLLALVSSETGGRGESNAWPHGGFSPVFLLSQRLDRWYDRNLHRFVTPT